MKLTSETKIFIYIFAASAIFIGIAAYAFTRPAKPIAKEKLVTSTAASTGTKDAEHFLVEFSDFQCPACQAFSIEVDKLAEIYPDDLLIVYRHFPLPQHEFAQGAAIAAEAAGVQGKFWEMNKLLFKNQNNLSEDKYISLATDLELDLDKFNSSRKDKNIIQKIQTDKAYANIIGVNSTPTFYLDGIKLQLNTPEDLTKQVEEVLK
ncbi:DsbA family protein [Patescibacteria group bacterium]